LLSAGGALMGSLAADGVRASVIGVAQSGASGHCSPGGVRQGERDDDQQRAAKEELEQDRGAHQ
jgi:hypothetical protein